MNRPQMFWIALWAGCTVAGLAGGHFINKFNADHFANPDKKVPPVTDSEKMWLELNAMRKVQDAILIYVRPDDEHAKQFAKTLKEAGIPNLPGVR